MYFWDKYSADYYSYNVTTYTANGFGPWSPYSTKSASSPSYGYPGYGFDSSNGYYTTGSYTTYSVSATFYRGGGTSLEEVQIFDSVNGVANYRTRTATASATTTPVSGYQQGSYIETITAAGDAYVSNSRNNDGYWYVRRLPVPPVLTFPNGGESITGSQTITWAGESVFTYQIQLTLNNGSTWKTLVANSSTGATSFVHNFTNESQSSLARVRVRAYDGSMYSDWDESNGVFTIQHNQPPVAPTKLQPNGIAIDRTKVQRLTWLHNDPNANDTQSSAVLEWKLQNAATWNVVNVSGNGQYFDVSANVFPAGEILWRVKTYDQSGAISPYSANAVFMAAEPSDAPVITAPATLVPIARPTVQWSSGTQTAYQVVVDDSLGSNVWDSGIINNANKAQTIGVDLVNGGQYVIKVRIKNNAGIWTDNAILQIAVSYTPPAKPIVDASAAFGCTTFDITNPLPIETEPNVVSNDIYKRINDEWVKIATNVLYQYRDYAVASGKEYEYKVVVTGDNGTFSESEIYSLGISFTGVWLHDVADPEGTVYQFKYDGRGRSAVWEVENSVLVFAGRKYPVIQTGDAENYIVNTSLDLFKAEDVAALERIVYGRGVVCYRDGKGRLSFGVITKLPIADDTRRQTVDLEILRIDYEESV